MPTLQTRGRRRMDRRIFSVLLLLFLVMSVQSGSADDGWPQFRGPGARGVSDESGLPTRWTTTENVVWAADIPGFGWSSPIVWDGTVYLTTVVSSETVETPLGGLYRGSETWRASEAEHRWLVYAFDVESGAVSGNGRCIAVAPLEDTTSRTPWPLKLQ